MSETPGLLLVATNRRARHDYHLEAPVEAGLVLQGSEVKSLREGKAQLQDAFVAFRADGADLVGVHIPPYAHGGYANHEPTRPRRLLLHRREIEKLKKGVEQKGYTIVPLRLYFRNGRAKVEIALAKGKKTYDKRETIATRDEQRRLDRVLKGDRRDRD
ncbi:MAG TPA: SsrA-binding protein SmpB [Rubricoccaceae bacterium]|nr:SsrA-binding protein SmpB [Rubricoccaceae bacterium]